MKKFTRSHLPKEWLRYRKIKDTWAARIEGPFKVVTKEGELSCPDGYLAVDSKGWPYPNSATATECFVTRHFYFVEAK